MQLPKSYELATSGWLTCATRRAAVAVVVVPQVVRLPLPSSVHVCKQVSLQVACVHPKAIQYRVHDTSPTTCTSFTRRCN